MSTQSFADLGASRSVVDALNEGGITAAFPVQRLVLPDALAGRDVLAWASDILNRLERPKGLGFLSG